MVSLKLPPKLLIASHNAGKVLELRDSLQNFGCEVVGAGESGLTSPEETGRTFRDNALLKASFAARESGFAALADDSGLEVDALGGLPGVDTAYYGGFERLLEALKNVPDSARGARFVCVLALVIPDQKPLFFEGSCRGRIAMEAQGNGDFGYDPVFIPEGDTRTFASMDKAEKKCFSHRGHALRRFLDWAGA